MERLTATFMIRLPSPDLKRSPDKLKELVGGNNIIFNSTIKSSWNFASAFFIQPIDIVYMSKIGPKIVVLEYFFSLLFYFSYLV